MIRLALDASGGQKVVLITSDAEAITVQTGLASAKKMKSQVTQKSNLKVPEEDFIHDIQQQYIAQGYVIESDDSDPEQKLFVNASFDTPVSEEFMAVSEKVFGNLKRTNGPSTRIRWQVGAVGITLSPRPDGLTNLSASTTFRRGKLAVAFILSLNPDAHGTDGTTQVVDLKVYLRQEVERSPLPDPIMELLYAREVLRRPFNMQVFGASTSTLGLHQQM